MKHKSGIVTGGTSGIGLTTAKLLSEMGCNVLVFGRSKSKLERAMKELGNNIIGINANVCIERELEQVFGTFDKHFEKLDFLVNNAAIAARSVLSNNPMAIKDTIDMDLNGYLIASKLASERMIGQRSGHIVNIGSLSSKTKDADTDLYVAAKSAIEGFSDSFRKSVNEYGIKVSFIQPGATATGMISESEEEKRENEENLLMLKPEDVASAVVYCLNQESRVEIMNVAIKPHRQII